MFIAAYGLVVFTGAMVGRSIAFTRTARRLSTAAIAATAIAVLCDVAENELLRPVVRNPHDDQNGLAVAAQAVSVTKWVLILPAASVALVAVLTTLWRAVGVTVDDHVRNDIVELPAVDEDEQLRGRTGGEAIRHSAWRGTAGCRRDA